MRGLFIFFLLLSGCATKDVCDYDLLDNGWWPTSDPGINQEHIEKDNRISWFTNTDGDFFACPELKGKGVCGNYYEWYRKKPGGSYEYSEIVCMQ
jgi:hypothetical protein